MANEHTTKRQKLKNRRKTIAVLLVLILILLLVRCGVGCDSNQDKKRAEVSIPVEILIHGSDDPDNPPVNPPDNPDDDDPDVPPVNPPDNPDDDDPDVPPVNPPDDDPDEPDDPDDPDNPDDPVDPPYIPPVNPPVDPDPPVEPQKSTATAILIELSDESSGKKMDADKENFVAEKMYPGDSVTKYYCLEVTCKDPVQLRFYTEIQQASLANGLAGVLKVKCTLYQPDQDGKYTISNVIYDGRVCDMKQAITSSSSSYTTQNEGVVDYFYELTVYLETSVGNTYQNMSVQNQTVYVDFNWELLN